MMHRWATLADVPFLAELNQQLIRDEGHRNRMTVPELGERMRGWFEAKEYAAVLFEDAGHVVAYGLFREQPTEIYLRQFFVVRDRRRRGIGREALQTFRRDIWPREKRLTVEVLSTNAGALAFYRALGYVDYSVTLEVFPTSVDP